MDKSIVIIRRYKHEDTAALMNLFYETIRAVNIRDYSQEQVEAWAPDAMDPVLWQKTLNERITFVAQIEATIAGFGELEEDGHINRFYVSRDHQRQGVGHRMLAAIEAEARNRGLRRLYVEASITARLFFERHDFEMLAEQTVSVRDVSFLNYRMEKLIR